MFITISFYIVGGYVFSTEGKSLVVLLHRTATKQLSITRTSLVDKNFIPHMPQMD